MLPELVTKKICFTGTAESAIVTVYMWTGVEDSDHAEVDLPEGKYFIAPDCIRIETEHGKIFLRFPTPLTEAKPFYGKASIHQWKLCDMAKEEEA